MKKHLYHAGEETRFREWLNNECFRRYILIVDAKTNGFCVPVLKKIIPEFEITDLIVIPDGEMNKTLAHVEYVWEKMQQLQITKKDLVICLGGGVLTDMAAFACSIFKRGVPFILIPTTLIGMVDASIGGKTAIDFSGVKNMIGSFCLAEAVFIHPVFLKTLPERQLKSGLAEQFKHALLHDYSHWNQVIAMPLTSFVTEEQIRYSSEWKWEFIENDLYDEGVRQALNLGHTVGHAIEAYSLQTKNPLLHGESIMYGLAIELKLSMLICGLSQKVYDDFIRLKKKHFPNLNESFVASSLIPFLKNDKKNDDQIRMTLLMDIGKPTLQTKVSLADIIRIIES